MSFAGMNYVAILLSAIAGFAFGALWYGVLGKVWMQAAGIDCKKANKEGGSAKQSYLPFFLAALANLMIAFMMAGMMGHFAVDVKHGLITASLVWIVFILPTIAVNYAFQMRPFRLTLIDSGHWLGVLVVIGVVIGLMGLST